MVGGYFIFEALFFNMNQALVSVLWNCIQWAGGVVAAMALYPVVSTVERTIRG
jgi:hypothetical protein